MYYESFEVYKDWLSIDCLIFKWFELDIINIYIYKLISVKYNSFYSFLGLLLLWASLGFSYYSEPHHLVYIFSVPSFCLSDNDNNLWILFLFKHVYCYFSSFTVLGFHFCFLGSSSSSYQVAPSSCCSSLAPLVRSSNITDTHQVYYK